MSQHKNEHDDLKGPHQWTREYGYQPTGPRVNEEAGDVAGTSDLNDDSAKYAEAVEFVKGRGYHEDAAKIIVEREGVDSILSTKADAVVERAPVMQPQIQEPTDDAEKAEDDLASA